VKFMPLENSSSGKNGNEKRVPLQISD